ncbi:MAG: hypothetical protein A2784_01870 [Candidatus Chisholmbacteria bacterium RIFCSPHIGHO2_01_FULL_48_12]|uniref:Uncharacterized protein n=1 Tax=Candidatus Chisholmbacteria bacterium RIFCSPHIGHO2_01_FULL_48_12 TaxID=1797589 RepID=A0A1G1VRA2_9BACT|nr:MAG: hypothetical protein A2784_01870 [Candidatus Chisholmbacteria bacterium RIFCSPHIGHO2_01_FULL_48_12]
MLTRRTISFLVLLLVFVAVVGGLGFFIYTPYSIANIAVVIQSRKWLVNFSEKIMRVVGYRDIYWAPRRIAVDAKLPSGEFVYFFPAEFSDINLGDKWLLTVKDNMGRFYRFPLYPEKGLGKELTFKVFELNKNTDLWEEAIYPASLLRSVLTMSQMLILTWQDNRSLAILADYFFNDGQSRWNPKVTVSIIR